MTATATATVIVIVIVIATATAIVRYIRHPIALRPLFSRSRPPLVPDTSLLILPASVCCWDFAGDKGGRDRDRDRDRGRRSGGGDRDRRSGGGDRRSDRGRDNDRRDRGKDRERDRRKKREPSSDSEDSAELDNYYATGAGGMRHFGRNYQAKQQDSGPKKIWDGFQWVTQTEGVPASALTGTGLSRKARRLHFGTLPAGCAGIPGADQLLASEIGAAFTARGMVCSKPDTNPVLSVWMSEEQNFSFVEFITAEDAVRDKLLPSLRQAPSPRVRQLGGSLTRVPAAPVFFIIIIIIFFFFSHHCLFS